MSKLTDIIQAMFKRKTFKILAVLLLFCATVVTARSALLTVTTSYFKPEQSTKTASETTEATKKPALIASKKKLPIYCVDTEEKKISISFDAAWGADDTDNILQTLKDNNVKATFFLCGYWVDKYPDEVKKIAADGHDIGNHGNTHAHGAQLTLEQNKKEIAAVTEKVKNLTGIEMNLFRPPFGEYNDTVLDAAKELNYNVIQWDVDVLDIKKYKKI